MLEIEVKEDSPEKLASVQGKPTKYYLFSQEFNAVVQKINEVYLGQNPNRITGLGTETVDGNQHTYQGYSWIINGADLDNIDNPSVIVIPTASVGFRRKDISVFNEFGNIVRVPGIETDGDIATTPDVPENTIYFRTYDVVGDLITSDEAPPFVGIEYKSKRESDSYTYDNAGENVILPLPGEGQSHLIVENEDIFSIDGFDKSILILVRNGEYPYEGKDYLFENKSPNPVQLNHLTSAEIPSILPNEENVVVPSGGSVWFKFKGDKMAYIMKSWNDPVDLSTKADLVGGKVPASQLPSYVDDVIEGYFNGTNFYTDSGFTNLITPESSKIYVALDTNLQYRWSGSAYVQIGGSGGKFSFKNITTYQNTGTITANLLFQTTIPANTLIAGDLLEFIVYGYRVSGLNANALFSIRISNTNNFATATQLAIATLNSVNFNRLRREAFVKTGNLFLTLAGTNQNATDYSTYSSPTDFSIDLTKDIYVFFAMQNQSAVDVTKIEGAFIIQR